jgi:hypothetical protein
MRGHRNRFMVGMVRNKEQGDDSSSQEIGQSLKGLEGRLLDGLGKGVSTFPSENR